MVSKRSNLGAKERSGGQFAPKTKTRGRGGKARTNLRVNGWPIAHPRRTRTGMTKSAIWMEDPTAMERERSILQRKETSG